MSSASVLSYDEAQEITDILSGDEAQEPSDELSCNEVQEPTNMTCSDDEVGSESSKCVRSFM